jgi:hypothetical protein
MESKEPIFHYDEGTGFYSAEASGLQCIGRPVKCPRCGVLLINNGRMVNCEVLKVDRDSEEIYGWRYKHRPCFARILVIND